MNERLLVDLTNAEQTNVTAYDFVSNGFKIRTAMEVLILTIYIHIHGIR